MELQITLASAAVAALMNIWLAMRCGKVRGAANIMHGDGGDSTLMKRMRAQANYVENTPFVLILILALEWAGHAGWPLAGAAALYFAGRIAHALGMENDRPGPARIAGALVTILTLLALAIVALLAAINVI